jgi:hypothetical protein
MSNALMAVLVSMLLLFILTVLPLIPAVVIYALFPKTTVVTRGPLSGLTLKSSGAFSVYIIVFITQRGPILVYAKTPLVTGPSSATEPSPHAMSSAACTTNIAGYSSRKGQVKMSVRSTSTSKMNTTLGIKASLSDFNA